MPTPAGPACVLRLSPLPDGRRYANGPAFGLVNLRVELDLRPEKAEAPLVVGLLWH